MLKDLLINHLAPGEIDRTGERVDGKATIIGKLKDNWIAVLDAEHRRILSMGNTRDVIFRSAYEEVTTNWYISPSWTPARLLTQIYDPVSSEVNTSVATESYPALFYCKNLRLLERPCALPNAQTLAFIWQKISFIDKNDPTISQNKSLLKFWADNIFCYTSSIVRNSVSALHFNGGRFTSIVYTAKYGIIPILEIPAYEDRTGERIDGKATIIGKLGDNWIAVLDAAYRGTANYSTGRQDVTAGIPYTSGTYTIDSGFTENQILAQRLYDIHSSKWNTDYLNQAQTATNFPAAKMCYDITIGGKHAQIPNIQATAFVYSKRNYIDANDPTAATNTAKKLSNWGFGAQHVFSSSGGGASSTAVGVTEAGTATELVRTATYGVIPILEIPLYKDRTGERVDGKATIAGKLGNYWIAVLDATFRAFNKKFGKYETDFSLPGVAYNYFITSDMTDEAAFLTQKAVDPNTSKFNTDYFKTQNTGADQYGTVGVPAAAHCFGIQINGQNAQLGNIQSTAFVFANSSFVDANDPTAETNPRFKLSNWSFDSTLSTRVFSSTKSGPQAQQAVDKSGQTYQTTKSNYSGVVPILEIPLWCDDDYK